MPADVFPRIVLFLSLLAACAASLPAHALELEAVLDAPMASSLVRSAEGRALAWVERAGGRRSIHVASAPTWEASEVHGFHRHASWLRAYRATADFLARELAVGAAP